MSYRRPMLFAVLCSACLIVAFILAGMLAADAVAHDRCEEDEPCWTWSTMGNERRGVTLKSGRHVVVSPCRFRKLELSRRIDWTRSARLKGDHIARRYGCNVNYPA